MDTSHARPVEGHPEDHLANDYSLTRKPAPENQDKAQIAVDLHSEPPAPEDSQKPALMDQPFDLAIEALAWLEREDPKLAFQAARIVGPYRRLWESCTSKHIEGSKLVKANHGVRETDRNLTDERNKMQLRHDDQIARLQFFDRPASGACESTRTGLHSVRKKTGRITIVNPCMQLPINALAMGFSTKNVHGARDHLVGRHGEGLKLAVLVLLKTKLIRSFKKCTPILLPSRKARRILCSVISISREKWFWVAVGSYEEEAMMVQKLGVLREASTDCLLVLVIYTANMDAELRLMNTKKDSPAFFSRSKPDIGPRNPMLLPGA